MVRRRKRWQRVGERHQLRTLVQVHLVRTGSWDFDGVIEQAHTRAHSDAAWLPTLADVLGEGWHCVEQPSDQKSQALAMMKLLKVVSMRRATLRRHTSKPQRPKSWYSM